MGERYNVEYLIPIFRSGRRSVMVWECFVGEIKGPLVFFDEYKEKNEKINADTYLRILENHLLPFYNAAYELVEKKLMFQQDNSPIHTAKKVAKWFKTKKIKIIDWPANLPDLNFIENIWKILKDNIQK
jgi:hypothetical protein